MQWSHHINNIATKVSKVLNLSDIISITVQPQQRPVLIYLYFNIPSNSTTVYQKSFYVRTIRDCNDLPSSSIETTDVEEFIRNLAELFII